MKIRRIQESTFEGLQSLRTLNLSNNLINTIEFNGFSKLNRVTTLYSENFLFCCIKRDLQVCSPKPDQFSSCDDVIRSIPLRIIMWILGLSSFLGNIAVIIRRLKSREKNKIQACLIFNLAISDGFMGVYMLIIAIADVRFRDVYVYKASDWLNSFTCSLAGTLCVISSEVSVYIITIVSLDRFICVVFPFSRFKLSLKATNILVTIGWLVGFFIAVIPTLRLPYFGDSYYGRTSVCLSLPFDNIRSSGWIFSVIIFLALNLVCLVTIASCYIAIIVVSKRSSRAIRSNRKLTSELKLASRTAMIVATDMFCWLPIVTLGVLGTSGAFKIPSVVYAWAAVFILPINSSVNPYLYTFSAIRNRGSKAHTTYRSSGVGCTVCQSDGSKETDRSHRGIELQMLSPIGKEITGNGVRYHTKETKKLVSGTVKLELTARDAEEATMVLEDVVQALHNHNIHPKYITKELGKKYRRVSVLLPTKTATGEHCDCQKDIDKFKRELQLQGPGSVC
ncbi:putative G-protein coupled receptor [Apostichopus japonicus]|uniref:Putative G-protein coupled receptor n=1 Tax=Stichopus japonicus TaxID=307972 RepID=A0A2G8LFT3_STIJA|nr:putative G-protein coupled receptor [Apostichopus japonicus]